MNISELLQQLKDRDIQLTVNDNKLKCRAAAGVVTPELQAAIKHHKPDILALLKDSVTSGSAPLQTNQGTALPQQYTEVSNSSVEALPKEASNHFPLVIQAPTAQADLCEWAREHHQSLRSQLLESGAILFRNFQLQDAAAFERFIELVSGKTMNYTGESAGVTPRSRIHGNIYTSTEFSPTFQIPLHSECSFAHRWPQKIFFYCVEAAAEGGATPIADSRKVLQHIPPAIQAKFLEKGTMYQRNYGLGSGPKWQQAFQTHDQTVVEDCCHAANRKFTWESENHLRTQAVRPAIVHHPQTGEPVWFNHTYQANIASLDSEIRAAMLSAFTLDDLPRNSYYGDGSEIEPEILQLIKTAYQKEKVIFTWQTGDVLMLDNMLTSHGREAFIPPRKVLVGMSEPLDRDSIPN